MSDAHPDTSETDPEEIMLDLVGKWHGGAGEGRSLIEYLGLTWADFAAWAELKVSSAETVAKMRRPEESARAADEACEGEDEGRCAG